MTTDEQSQLQRLLTLTEDLTERVAELEMHDQNHASALQRLIERETACGLVVDRLEKLVDRVLAENP